jgi:4-aminobutyrate aminotransferase-like enzyme
VSRISSTWNGDPSKLIQVRAMIDIIERDKLIEQTARVGGHMLTGLKKLVVSFVMKITKL